MNRASGIQRSAPGRTHARDADLRACAALNIRRLATDSRRVVRGDTFVAYRGETQDGRGYIPQAIASGARSVLWEKHGFRWNPHWRVPNLGVPRLRARSGEIASRVYGDPSSRLWMVGVTGTNGKTTCSQWIARALAASGRRSAVIGTLGHGTVRANGAKLRALVNTTPDAVWLHARLAQFVRRGTQAVAMEVSSIGLDQDRLAGVQFDVALFTNLTRDHLDYHRTLRRYGEAKAKLFEVDSLKYAVINTDDSFGARLARGLRRRELEVIGYGFGAAANRRGSNVAGSGLVADTHGIRFVATTPWGTAAVASPLVGRFNASNLLAVLAVLLASGVGLRNAVAIVERLKPVAGRMQKVGGGRRPLVVVDYAHTPDALCQVLNTLRPMTGRDGARLICVFGCGGDRDRGKRPLMGRVAERLADRVVLTNDNPRGENPARIVADVRSGMRTRGVVELDRARAIRGAIADARRGDVVLIAGKGHETYQEVKGVRRAFNDCAAARAAIAKWRAA